MFRSVRLFIVCFAVTSGSLSRGQEVTESKANAGGTEATPVVVSRATSTAAEALVHSGIDQPVILVPATTDEVTVKVLLRGLDAAPAPSDLEAGLLVSASHPNLQLRPTVTLASPATATGRAMEYVVELKIRGLVTFGESHAPLLYKGKQVESLRFSKPGLVARPAGEGGFVAREGSKLPIVLENPSAFEYKSVRARLRFADIDACTFDTETFPGSIAPASASANGTAARASGAGKPDDKAAASEAETAKCATFEKWQAFEVPRYAQVTLRGATPPGWFQDPDTGYAHAGKKKGWLTLRFQGDGGRIHEQNLPLEVQFEPSDWSFFKSLARVGGFLVIGALLSLALRVMLPNLKRRRQLKDQLSELAKQTASVSTEVDSNLRVLLRVERIALNELRKAVWPVWPGFADSALRVEQGLPALKRRIDAVKRLDATLAQKKWMVEQGAAPTRIEQIESQLVGVSESLKQEQLTDEDWVFVNQSLEAAQKSLRVPTPAEKEAFDSMLAGRWKSIRERFFDENYKLKLPEALEGFRKWFPDLSLLPKEEDADGSHWIQSVGAVRADLQLSALLLLLEFQFLAPAVIVADDKWTMRVKELERALVTPAIGNLADARSLLRQLAENIFEEDVLAALMKRDSAIIAVDPALPRPNQKIRFSLRFREDQLNSATARDLVRCHWRFSDRPGSMLAGSLRDLRSMFRGKPATGNVASQSESAALLELSEDGWFVHHYFERDVDHSAITVSFYDSKGDLVKLDLMERDGDKKHWSILDTSVKQGRRHKEEWNRGLLELFQLSAALLVPLATLASTTLSGGGSGHWWELIAIGFGADTIKSILVGQQGSSSST